MNNSEYDTFTAWVCVCCFVALVNGDGCQCCEGHGEDYDSVNGCEQHPHDHMDLLSDCEPTPGMLGKHHPCTEWEHGVVDNCDCETDQFSWSSCDGCGTHLGGERHAVTGWIKI